jgi:hypothetical protein
MQASSYVPSFYFYKLAQAISAPYTSLQAYSAGSIDENGNIVKPESSIDPFEYLVIKLKQIFDQLPYGVTKAKLSNYMATLQMFSENVEQFNISKEHFNYFVEGIIAQNSNGSVSYLELLEDMSVGAAGGAAGSLGTPIANSGPSVGVAGYDPKLMAAIQRRKTPKFLDDCEIFDLCPEDYASFKMAKAWKGIPDSPTKNYIQRFMRRNKGKKVAVRTVMPETGDHDLYWITYPAQNFMEEYKINLSYFNLE